MAVAMQRSLSASALSTMVSHNSVSFLSRRTRGSSSKSRRSDSKRTAATSASQSSSSSAASEARAASKPESGTDSGVTSAHPSSARPTTDDVFGTDTIASLKPSSPVLIEEAPPFSASSSSAAGIESSKDLSSATTTSEKRVMRVQSESDITALCSQSSHLTPATLHRFKEEIDRGALKLRSAMQREGSDASDSSLSSSSSGSDSDSLRPFDHHSRQRTGSGQASCSELADMTTPSLSSLATVGGGTSSQGSDPLKTAILCDATLQGGFEEKSEGSQRVSSERAVITPLVCDTLEIVGESELVAAVQLAVAERSKAVSAAAQSRRADSPSSKKKKKRPSATLVDYQSVLDAHHYAQIRDLESVLRENEGHLLEYRDRVYEDARKSGVSPESMVSERLSVIGKVVEYLFHEVEPPDVYTKKTDIGHFKEVAALAIQGAKKKWVSEGGDLSEFSVPITLVLSAWLHDVERFIPSVKCKYLHESVDKYRKQLVHPLTSARVAMVIFKGAPLTDAERQRVFAIIEQHDKPVDQVIYILDKLLLDKPKPDILDELQTLMDADSMAFFKHTVGYFVEVKSKKYSPSWMWTRIITNVKRLRPPLRGNAVDCMDRLSEEIKAKMGWVKAEVVALCPPDLEDTTTSPLVCPLVSGVISSK